jgi:hypothetical protein
LTLLLARTWRKTHFALFFLKSASRHARGSNSVNRSRGGWAPPPRTELFASWQSWAEKAREFVLPRARFFDALEARGFARGTSEIGKAAPICTPAPWTQPRAWKAGGGVKRLNARPPAGTVPPRTRSFFLLRMILSLRTAPWPNLTKGATT